MKRILFTLVYVGSITFATDPRMVLSNLLNDNDDNELTSSRSSVAPLRVNAATSSSSSQARITIRGSAPASSQPDDISSNATLYDLCMNKYPRFARFIDYGIGEMQSNLDAFRTLNPFQMSLVMGFFVKRHHGFSIARRLSESEKFKTAFNYMLPRYRPLYGTPQFCESWDKIIEQCKRAIATSKEDCDLINEISITVECCRPSNFVVNNVVDDFYYQSLGHLSDEEKALYCQEAMKRAEDFQEAAGPIFDRAWHCVPAPTPAQSRTEKDPITVEGSE